jgi:uncharacterized membrane protein
MKTNEDAILNWELGNTRRYVRGIIGTAALMAVLLIPSLSEGWLFLLAMIGAYESMTAIVNTDLFYCVLNLGIETASATGYAETVEEIATSPLNMMNEQQRYRQFA